MSKKTSKPAIAVIALEGDGKGRKAGDVIDTFDGGIPARTLLPPFTVIADAAVHDTPAKCRALAVDTNRKRAVAARKQADAMKRLTSRLTVEAMSSDPLDPATAGKHAKARAQVKESLAAQAFAAAAQSRLDAAKQATDPGPQAPGAAPEARSPKPEVSSQ